MFVFSQHGIGCADAVPELELADLQPYSLDKNMEFIIDRFLNPQADGPYGARGIGEHPMVSVPSVIANAVYDALGINFYELPLSPEKVALAIKREVESGKQERVPQE